MDNAVSLKFTNSVDNLDKLQTFEKTLTNIYSLLSGIDTGQLSAINQLSTKTQEFSSQDTKKIKNVGQAFSLGFDLTKLKAIASSIESIIKKMSTFTSKSSTYIENLNLLDVAFDGTTEEIEKFINKMSEMYGLDESELTRTVGIFKQLSNAFGLADETGTKLSETLTQMSVDIASLYNVDVDRATSVLQSALANQTKPIRTLTGADITQTTLQVTLDTIGLDRTVDQLSYAEKRLLIVISLIDQLEESQNDYGRTVESVANQMKVFDEQLSRLARAIGNVFLPVLQKILPYLNAILMVATEIISWFAVLVGYNSEDFDYFDSAVTSVESYADALDSASDSASNLKRGLRGFDKLNNLTTPSSSSSSSSGGSSIDPNLLSAFDKAVEGYNNALADVKMKATDIRDRIMEWLGFTKIIDDETGEVSFKFEKITGGTVLGALVVGGTIYSGIMSIYKIFKKLGLIDFSKITGFFKILSESKIGVAVSDIATGIGGWATGAWSFAEAWELIAPALGTLGGVAVAIGGIVVAIDGINRILAGDTFSGIAEIIGGIAIAVAGVAVVFGAWPVAIGAAIVASIALIVAFWDEISAFFTNIWNWINTNILQPVIDFFTPLAKWINDNVIQPIIDFFTPIIDAIVEIVTLIWDEITGIVTGVANAVWSIIKKIGEILAKIIEIFVALAKAFYDYIIKPIWEKYLKPAFKWFYNTLIKPIVDLFKSVGEWVYKNIIKPVWDKIVWLKDKAVDVFKTVGTAVVTFVSNAFKGVINGVLSLIESTINGFIKLLNGAISIINKIPGVNITKVSLLSIPRLETGLDYVPKDFYGPVYLDQGERVLTKEENQDYSSGKISSGVQNATFIIQVGSKEVAREVLTDLQSMAKSNGKPIKIGG